MDNWMQSATFQNDVKVDIGFMACDSFYFGPENGLTPEQYETMRVSLYQPELKKSGSFILSCDVIGHEEELIKHYRDVVQKYAEYGKDISQSTHFWNRPVIYNSDFVISFPWHDHFREGKNVLDHLTSVEDGNIYRDIDQGWALDIAARDDLIYAREWDPDYEEIHYQVKFDRVTIRQQAKALMTDVPALIQKLSAALGHDYWT
ncbi:hypothetical protein [Gynuella sunshinyii]|uniref:Uncharacterized protein n=1 Tax=Gynuella sunshinyii YC6258 TaxID=1445510 RepID=A0A0C5V5V7_9GAMM|nr:hypothetical protein [Gynuella sunshinyii]AJQ94830.1 hypothetical Protein YC6258_02792 [Gynuella sunshinyii YC6258]